MNENMKKTRLKLEDLKVQSFVTSLNDDEKMKLKGGLENTAGCSNECGGGGGGGGGGTQTYGCGCSDTWCCTPLNQCTGGWWTCDCQSTSPEC